MKTILRVFLLITLISTLSIADIINVPADIDSIQGGINMASNGDTVLVDVGTYYENINFNGKNIVVGSLTLTTSETSYISQTVIDGDRSGSVVTFVGGEDSTAVLCGFTITNGLSLSGGGINIRNSHPIIREMLIINNKVRGRNWGIGGGISCYSSNPLIKNVTIKENIASDYSFEVGCGGGGGLHCTDSNPTLLNVTLSNNHSDSGGGGINCSYFSYAGFADSSSIYLSNVTITNNTSIIGGGIYSGTHTRIHFDTINRCNIYSNYAEWPGDDLFSETDTIISVVVDTFTVMNPDSSQAYPLNKFNFDIMNVTVTNISENSKMPSEFYINQNYPNPFNPSTTIEFTLPKSEFVTLKIYNILGEEIATLVNDKLQAGNHTYPFDGSNLASGVYIYKIEAGEYEQVRKMVLLK